MLAEEEVEQVQLEGNGSPGTTTAGAGGAGLANSITGSAVT
jgi:hypothetical protein